MDSEELERYNADLLAEIRADAALAERERQARLDEMMAPGLEAIIARARKDPTVSPDDIELDCLRAIQNEGESQERLSKLRRDAASAGALPAGDAPRLKPWQKIVASANGRRMP